MTARDVLAQAKELLTRHHYQPAGQWLIAVDARGNRARPVSPDAVAWSVIGALCHVAPGQTMASPEPYADLSAAGENAREVLAETASLHGFLSLAEVDRAGHAAVQRLCSAALTICEPEPRPRLGALSGTGSQPRGVQT